MVLFRRICGSLLTVSRIGCSTLTAGSCGIVGTIGTVSGDFNACGDVVTEVIVLVFGVIVPEATDCLLERPIRFNCADGIPMLY